MNKNIAKIFIPRPDLDEFFYEIPKNLELEVGDLVEIELISKLIWGIITDFLEELPKELQEKKVNLKQIQKKIVHTPLFEEETQTKFLKWVSNYYIYPFPKIVKQIFSPFLLKNKLPKLKKEETLVAVQKENIKMTLEQEKITGEIKNQWQNKDFRPILLFGVTGSGKSEIYANLAKTIFEQNKQVLFLVPEIGLTNSALNHFEKRFGEKGILLHSYMTRKERYSNYEKAKNNEIKFIIGTRSSILYPFLNLGLIVVDEEHDQSFKNFEPPYYNARDCGVMKAKMMNIPIILGTATPSTESYFNALNNKYVLKKLTKRANGKKMPKIETFSYKSDNYIPSKVVAEIKKDIKNGYQTLFFLNRRGFSTVAICQECENIETCPNCKTALIYHKKEEKLICHHCNYSIKLEKCSSCGSKTLKLEGMGIEKLFSTLTNYFPESKIVSIDKDSIKNNKIFNKEIEKITNSEYDIITGTIMISKGHNFPKLKNIVIKFSDYLLNFSDYRASEKCFQTIIQVAGRAGRFKEEGKIWAETTNKEHYIWQYIQKYDYEGFLSEELSWREELNLPPFSRQITIKIAGKIEQEVKQNSMKIYRFLRNKIKIDEQTQISPPIEPPLFGIQNKYRNIVIINSKKINHIKKAMFDFIKNQEKNRRITITFDVDS